MLCVEMYVAVTLTVIGQSACSIIPRLIKVNNDIWEDSDPMSESLATSKNFRLPSTIVPSYYRLKLKPSLQESRFSGEVYITLQTNAHNTKKIILHSKDININKDIVLTEQIYERHTVNKVKRTKRQAADNSLNEKNSTLVPAVSAENTTTAIANESTTNPVPASNQPIIENATETNVNTTQNATDIPISPASEIKEKTAGESDNKNSTVSGNNASITNNILVPKDNVENKSSDTSNIIVQTNIDGKDTLETKATDTSNFLPPTNIQPIDKDTSVIHGNTRNIKVISVEVDNASDGLILNLEAPLKPGMDYTLQIAFDGNITESLSGFYKSTYEDADHRTKVLAITQFEPTYARTVFPCFDEPDFKAMFEISIAHIENHTVLSNMPVSSEEPITDEPGWSWTHFERSVKMSTYLVAYAITDFKYLETTYLSKDNTTKPIKVWARPSLIENAGYAIKIVPKVLEFYEQWFGIPYVLNKIDLIAVPDFSSGAMENWGLITFRETLLLYDEKQKDLRNKQNVAVDICHELAHQWFGNLVTMKWWTDLWLNEGFATYVEYVGVDHIEPEWGMLDTFTRDKMELLRTDALKHTTPVSKVVNQASEISQKFDEISYSKGASLIRMLNHTMTEPLFHKGLVHYLNKWIFANAEETDLWAAMSDATESELSLTGVSVVKFMNSWTRQAGYPVVNVERDYGVGDVVFTQNYFTTMAKPYDSMLNQLWSIPISYVAIDAPSVDWQTSPKIWLNDRTATVNVNINSSQAVYVNVYSIGYYRVNYDEKNWLLLKAALNTPDHSIPPLTRAQLIDDAFNLAKVNKLEYKCALDLTTYLLNGEDSRTVWELVLSNLGFLKFNLKTSAYYPLFQDYVYRILHEDLSKHNYGLDSPASDDEIFLIENLVAWECHAESERCLNWAKQEFNKWMQKEDFNDNSIPSYLRGIVYTVAIRYGGRPEFDFLWNVFNNSTDPNVKSVVLGVLPSTRDESLINLLLERSLTVLPNQYKSYVWSFDTLAGSTLAQEFFYNNWQRIFGTFNKLDTFIFSSIISGTFALMTTEREVERFKEFVSSHSEEMKPYMQTIRKLVDSATMRRDWIQLHQVQIEQWLQDFSNNNTKADSPTAPNATSVKPDANAPTPVPDTELKPNNTIDNSTIEETSTILTPVVANVTGPRANDSNVTMPPDTKS